MNNGPMSRARPKRVSEKSRLLLGPNLSITMPASGMLNAEVIAENVKANEISPRVHANVSSSGLIKTPRLE